MKIAFIHRYDPAFGLGGASQVVLDLALSFHERGHEVVFLTNRGELDDRLKAAGITTVKLPVSRLNVTGFCSAVSRVLRDFKPDVIHSHHRFTTFILDLFFKKRVPIIHTEHVMRQNRKLLFRYGHHATGVSTAVTENLITTYHVPKDNVSCIPNGVKLSNPDPEDSERLKKEFAVYPDRLNMICIGRLSEQKGHIYLLEALGMLKQDMKSKIKIYLIGDGELAGSLKAKAKELNLSETVEFVGYSKAVPEWLSLADLVMLPSLWEGLPLAVLEAFEAGKPVLATSISGTVDIVQDNISGWLVPSGDSQRLSDAIVRCVEERERLPEMANAALERGKEFSHDKMLERYLELYGKVKR